MPRAGLSGSSFFSSVASLSFSRGILLVSQIAILPIIARFLTAADFGAFALAMTLVIFAQLLSDAGLGRSLIRQPVLDDLEWNSVFWLLVATGLAITTVLLLSAPLWALIFDLPRIQGLVMALSVVPLLSALTAIPSARLERDRMFHTLAVLRTASALVGLAGAAIMAIWGFGVWALVGQQIALAVCLLAGSFCFSNFKPMRGFSTSGLRKHLVFARDTIGTSLLFTVQRQVPLALIGYVLGASSLGLFEMARRLLMLPQMGLTGPASQVIFVRMIRNTADLEAIGEIYVATIRLFAIALFPPVAVLAASGHIIFPSVLSERWAPVADLFLFASLGFVVEAIVSAGGVAFQATGRTGVQFRMQVERTILRIVLITAAVSFGILAVAITISLFALLFLPRYWSWINRVAPFQMRAAWSALLVPTATSVSGALGLYGALNHYQLGLWSCLALATGVTFVLWIGCAALQHRALCKDLTLLRA